MQDPYLIEVLVEAEEPKYLPFSREQLIIGSAPTADICIPHPEITRRHLQLIRLGNKFFVEDKGSTNGSYIGKEILAAGVKRELPVGVFVRLGTNVLVSVVTKEAAVKSGASNAATDEVLPEASNEVIREEKTVVRSLADLKEASAEKIIHKRATPRRIPKAKVIAKPKKQGFFSKQTFVGILICLALIGLWKEFQDKPKRKTKIKAPVSEVDDSVPVRASEPLPAPLATKVESASALPASPSTAPVAPEFKQDLCTGNNLERYCLLVKGTHIRPYGAYIQNNVLISLVDAQESYQLARELLKDLPSEETALLSSLIFLKNAFNVKAADYQVEQYQFRFYLKGDSGPRMYLQFLISSYELERLMGELKGRDLAQLNQASFFQLKEVVLNFIKPELTKENLPKAPAALATENSAPQEVKPTPGDAP